MNWKIVERLSEYKGSTNRTRARELGHIWYNLEIVEISSEYEDSCKRTLRKGFGRRWSNTHKTGIRTDRKELIESLRLQFQF